MKKQVQEEVVNNLPRRIANKPLVPPKKCTRNNERLENELCRRKRLKRGNTERSPTCIKGAQKKTTGPQRSEIKIPSKPFL